MPIGSDHDCYNVFIARRKFRKFGVGQPPFAETRVPFTQCFLRNRGGVISFYNFKGKLLLRFKRICASYNGTAQEQRVIALHQLIGDAH